MKELFLVFAFAAFAAASQGGGREALKEDYGYVEVRPGAHMFWVMYHVDQPGDHTDYPLIMWLQGGPGASGVGYGNFQELGPYDINGNAREYAWTKKANVMFVDNPVGTGYSYVEDYSKLSTNNTMIALDLVAVVKSAFAEHPHMQVMPFYVFAESYGGKMTVDFALEFDKAIKNGEVVSDFRGVALGDSWISPMDSVNTWGTFLYQLGIVNQRGLQAIDEAAADAQAAVDAGRWSEATDKWSNTEVVVMIYGNNVNFYNVLAKDDVYRLKEDANKTSLSFMSPTIRRLYDTHVAWQTRDSLGDFMNGEQADHWGIPDGVVWDSQGSMVFNALSGDFMKPVIDSVVQLLTETDLHVAVFTGNLDLICDTPGTYRWIENMEWPGKPAFMAANNDPIFISAYSANAATIQASGKFSLYTILRSGHMVPIDAPEMSLKMLDMIFASTKEKPTKQEAPHKEVEKQEEAVTQEEAPKHREEPKEAPKQKVPPKPETEEKPEQKALNLKALKKEALEEEAKKEEEAAKQVKKAKETTPGKQTEEKETAKRQKENKKENKKQKASKVEKVPEGKKPKKSHKQEKAPKQEQPKEEVAKQEKQKQEKAPKQEKIKQKENRPEEASKQEKRNEKVARPERYKQKVAQKEKGKHEKVEKQEKYKQQDTQEKTPKKEAKKVNKAKAKVIAARQQQQRGFQHHPGPLPDPLRRR